MQTQQRARDRLAEAGAFERIPRGLGFSPDRANDPDPAQRVSGDAADVSPVPRRREPTRRATSTGPADRRMQQGEGAVGFRAGGQIRTVPLPGEGKPLEPVAPGTVDLISGPGTATSDSIPARMQQGTHILPTKTTEDVLLSDGEAAVSPEVVQQVGQAALDALRAATRGSSGFKPIPGGTPGFFAGGTVGEDEQRQRTSFGDAAAASQDSRVAQIPTTEREFRGQQLQQQRDTTVQRRSEWMADYDANGAQQAAQAREAASGRLADAAVRPYRPGITSSAVPSPDATGGAAMPAGSSTAGAGRGTAADPRSLAPSGWVPSGAPPVPQPGQPGPNPENKQIMGTLSNNIVRSGNSYSSGDGGPITAGATINGREVDRLSVVPTSSGAGGGLGVSSPAIPGGTQPQVYQQAPGTDWQSRQDLRNAQTGASSIVNSPARAQAQAEVQRLSGIQLQGVRNAGDTEVAGIRAGTERAGQAITAQNNAAAQRLAAGRFGLDETRATQEAQTRGNLLQVQGAYLGAATPEARAQALSTMQALQGATPAPRFTVVPGGTDDMGNRQASAVFNNQTGQFVQQQPGAQGAAGQRAVGTVSTVNGRSATWDGSKWVPR